MKKYIFVLLSIFFIWFTFSVDRNLQWINLISRKERWANEKYLFSNYEKYKKLLINNKKYIEQIKKDINKRKKYLEKQKIEEYRRKYLINHWKNQFRIDNKINYISWNKLRRPLMYKKNKTRIIIHHTAWDYKKLKNIDNVKKAIRNIYYYHAIKRWRWDIGYNFIIWPFWNIYEWKKWWESIVWANSKRNNIPSIWIALIWNFNIEKPTNQQINSLIKLLTVLSKKYNINPLSKVTYHKSIKKYPYIKDITWYSIAWHKDTWSTQCPWKFLYKILPYIRQQVANNLKNNYVLKNNKKISFIKSKITHNLKLSTKFTLNWTIKFKITNEKIFSCESLTKFISVKCKNNYITINTNKTLPTIFRNIKIKTVTKNTNYIINFKAIFMEDIRLLIKNKIYNMKYKLAKYHTKKITYKIYVSKLKDIDNLKINVLLYELSKFNHYEIHCSKNCIIKTDKWTFKNKNIVIDKISSLLVWLWKKVITTNYIEITPVWDFVYFDNYKRKSYAWISWNYFRWKIIFKRDYIKEIWWKIKNTYSVINSLKLKNYLEWIAEWNDQEHIEKLKVMALLAKDYVLFYQNKKNIHPSIPKNASYNAIDDPRIFQKYVWAWFEKTSKLWKKVLDLTKNKIITYNWYIPILPYFSCSKWFTFSAYQKFWRTDTPYLKNSPDVVKCNKFYWHWVWLSWKWAWKLAKLWLKYTQIIKWYFPSVNIETY